MSFLIAIGKTMLLEQNQIHQLELTSVHYGVRPKLAEQRLAHQP